MSVVRFWKCDITTGALLRINEALDICNVPIYNNSNDRILLTVKLYQRILGEYEENTIDCRRIFLMKSSKEPEKCWIIGGEHEESYLVASSEMESLIVKLYGGTIKPRQTVSIQVTKCSIEGGGMTTIAIGTISLGNSALGIIVLFQGESIEQCEKTLNVYLPCKFFPDLQTLYTEPDGNVTLFNIINKTVRLIL